MDINKVKSIISIAINKGVMSQLYGWQRTHEHSYSLFKHDHDVLLESISNRLDELVCDRLDYMISLEDIREAINLGVTVEVFGDLDGYDHFDFKRDDFKNCSKFDTDFDMKAVMDDVKRLRSSIITVLNEHIWEAI